MVHFPLLSMSNLTAARWQMAVSLAFHMVFAAIGIGLPVLMVIAERRWMTTGREHFRDLARKWAKATGLLFAVGAVSGTALSFELGLLWPRYMEVTGAAVGHIFALEGYAFFIEAIFIGLYLYGWNRLSPRGHWWCGVVIAVSGAMSGIFILGVNSWMQLPIGFEVGADGRVTSTQPMAIFTTYAWWTMAMHSTLSCYIAVGFAVAAVYAAGYLRGRRDEYHRSAMRIALAVGSVCAILQPVSGDLLAKFVYRTQPAKFAAMEAHFETRSHAPMHVGGIPDTEAGVVRYSITVPNLLSFLAGHDPATVVQGLNDIPRELWPNVRLVHWCFEFMVSIGFALAGLGLWFFVRWWRRRGEMFEGKWFGRVLVVAGPLGFVALEAGWIVTEVGRQPWVIQPRGAYPGMRTAEAVTTHSSVAPFLFMIVGLYLLLSVALVVLLRYLARDRRGWSGGVG